MHFLVRLHKRGSGFRRFVPLLSVTVAALTMAISTSASASGVLGWGGAFGDLPTPVSGGLGDVTAISAGGLALRPDGSVVEWSEGSTPRPVSGLGEVTAIASGDQFGLALLRDGTVMAWGGLGNNRNGEMGDGNFEESAVPVRVSGLSEVTAIAAGETFGLALLRNGTVMAWGSNNHGELGDGSFEGRDTPRPVDGLSEVTAIAAGPNDSLALLSDGTVKGWGSNWSGQLGDGELNCCSSTEDEPVAVSGLDDVTAISASEEDSLALLGDGTVRSWGSDEYGQLGNDTLENTTHPVDHPVVVSNLSEVTAIASGDEIGMALLRNGTVMDWGLNGRGGLGIGTDEGPEFCRPISKYEEGGACSNAPVAVSELSGVAGISGGDHFSVALVDVVPVPVVTTSSLPEGQADTGYAATLAASGGTGPYTWSLASGSLPAGLHLNPANGAILGTPTTPGTSSFTVQLIDSSSPTPASATANLSITVGPAAVQAAEYGECVAQKKGEYTEGNCRSKSAKAKKGSFEWKPGPAPSCVAQKKGFYTTSKCETISEKKGKPKGQFEKASGSGYTSTTGTVTLEAPGLGHTITCSTSSAKGEVTGTQTGVQRITFTGCESSGNPCRSEGPNSTPSGETGVIVTNLLDTRLIGPVAGQVSIQLLSSEHQPYLAEFGCEGKLFRTIGSVAGTQSGDVNTSSNTSTTTFASGQGEQALDSELSENGGTSWLGPAPSTETTTATNTAASKIEIKT